jgi:Family of unknown function (DUF5681)
MSQADRIRPWKFKPGQSGNPAGRKPNPRRSFNAVQRLEALGADPLEEVIALARNPKVPEATRLKAWMALMDYSYPKLAPVVPSETMNATLEELQRSWDAATLDEFKEAFRKELDTLPTDARAALEKMSGIGPLLMQALLKFVEQHHEQARDPVSSDPPEPLKLAVDEQRAA